MAMTESTEEPKSVEDQKQKLSRRDFLKLSSIGIAVVVGKNLLSNPEDNEFKSLSENIEGVDVFGIESKIDSQNKFDNIYAVIATDFENKIPWHASMDKVWEKRDTVLGKNVRALEVVVKQSDYDKAVANGGFVLYMKRHIDMQNRISRQATPKVNIEAKLARVIVVDDSFISHPAYKWMDYEKQLASYVTSPDVDFSEFIGDEKGSGLTVSGEGATFWNVTDNGSSLKVSYGTGPDKFGGRIFTLPHDESDSLMGVRDFPIDYYYLHEWRHRLDQGVDDYIINMDHLDEEKFEFRAMRVENGNWAIPYLSPYSTMTMNWMANRGVRGYYEHPDTVGGGNCAGETEIYQQQPTKVELEVVGSESIEVYSTKKVGNYDADPEYPEFDREVDWDNMQAVQGNSIALNVKELAKPSIYIQNKPMVNAIQQEKTEAVTILPTIYLVRAKIGGQYRALHLPVAIFNMSKLGGGLDSASYSINIVGDKMPNNDTLKIAYLNKKDVEDRIAWINQTGGRIYATMEIDGTDSICLWFQHEIRQKMNLKTTNVTMDPDKQY